MRQLLAQERPLVSHLFAAAGLPFDPEALMVTPMSDGGMGSLALGAGYESRKMGRQVAECHFVDKDEVLVSATLNVDTQGEPYEVDMWKVNFEPTVEWPASAAIRSGPPNSTVRLHKQTMLRTIAIFAVSLVIAHLEQAQAQAQSIEAIGCVSPEKLECGCRVRVQNLACTPAGPGYGVHFFTGLELNDPLHMVLGGKAFELAHAKHRGESVKGDSDGRWVDEYVSEMLSVKISYVPGRSTCPKDKGEPCEFSDYDADVVVRSLGSTPRTYRATARCGC